MVKKETRNQQSVLRELISRHQQNIDRITDMADLCEKENRERTKEEDTEYEILLRDNSILEMKMRSIQSPAVPQRVDSDTVLRDTLHGNQRVTVMLMRDMMMAPELDGTGIIPIQQQEMLKPLRKGLIYDKVGLTIRTGLSGGTLRWPRYGKAQAKWVKEGDRLENSKIDFSKLEVKPERLGVAL